MNGYTPSFKIKIKQIMTLLQTVALQLLYVNTCFLVETPVLPTFDPLPVIPRFPLGRTKDSASVP